MGNAFTLLFDYREAGFPISAVYFLLGFLCLAGLLFVGLALHPGGRKVMQGFMDSWPVRIPYPVFAVVYFLAFAVFTGLTLRGAYQDYRAVLNQLDDGVCRKVNGPVENFSKRAVGGRTTTRFVNFQVGGVRFRYTGNSRLGYRDVDGPLKNGTPVRITYCGRGRIIARLEASL